jgi:cation transport regulator ChaC
MDVRDQQVGRKDGMCPMGYPARGAPIPEEEMLYFAYGSNLNAAQMSERCPAHKIVGLGELRDHKLIFPVTSPRWGGGVAGLHVAHGQSVWGVVFDLNDEDLASLDRYEGFKGPGDPHNVYDQEHMFVELRRADDGSFPRRVRPLTYVARPNNPAPPSRRYLEAIIAGAAHHRLPDEYIALLARIPTAEEPALD